MTGLCNFMATFAVFHLVATEKGLHSCGSIRHVFLFLVFLPPDPHPPLCLFSFAAAGTVIALGLILKRVVIENPRLWPAD